MKRKRIIAGTLCFLLGWIVFAIIACVRVFVQHDEAKNVVTPGQLISVLFLTVFGSAIAWFSYNGGEPRDRP